MSVWLKIQLDNVTVSAINIRLSSIPPFQNGAYFYITAVLHYNVKLSQAVNNRNWYCFILYNQYEGLVFFIE